MCTGQLLVIAVEIVVLIAVVSSWLPSPIAPLQRTSTHGRPEHITRSPPIVAVPVVDNVEKFPGDCAKLGRATPSPKANAASQRRRLITTCAPRKPGPLPHPKG